MQGQSGCKAMAHWVACAKPAHRHHAYRIESPHACRHAPAAQRGLLRARAGVSSTRAVGYGCLSGTRRSVAVPVVRRTAKSGPHLWLHPLRIHHCSAGLRALCGACQIMRCPGVKEQPQRRRFLLLSGPGRPPARSPCRFAGKPPGAMPLAALCGHAVFRLSQRAGNGGNTQAKTGARACLTQQLQVALPVDTGVHALLRHTRRPAAPLPSPPHCPPSRHSALPRACAA